jgi:hypothetical protein
MSAEIINLRKARKQRDRAAKAARGDQSRAQSGRSKAERQQAANEVEAQVRHLDGHWLGGSDAQDGDKKS